MKIGLVLSGGGGKGAYELGVWKALKELGLDKYISVFSGTSIGAFNAVLFAQDDMMLAEQLWDEVTMDKLVPISKFELFKKGMGLIIGTKNPNFAKKYMNQKLEEGTVSKDGAVKIIEKYLKVDMIKERKKICYVTCTELPELKVKYFRLNDYDSKIAKAMILASASLPLIYDSTPVFENSYVDGGIVDNTPIQPVYGENCDVIIVVSLSKDAKVDRLLYPNTHIIEIYPRNLVETILTGTLNLDKESKRNRIKEGYNDTKILLKPIMLMANFQKEKEEEENYPKLYKIYNWSKDVLNKKIE
ncbi:patatin-like phospholipase family protein [Clostridium gasigenes]|uniref:NTE family protein n=1 Tax=Clostridium gasigenes TaxID=94869 RepID=A0A1H0NMK3_9CLOT|nr:patatin-like phospholipase family protein [Clostridium gasigenes]MBU3087553.1 patatin-like phospholipase family protein [Clostridium gasigenes]NKF05519.1 patatin-like phospholipase family protein [Clostridium gasigenes]QSW18962.1 patatin-like phospholipase family protein [Clostridium gasigenes]SDO93768.1 NTE family protein [Clostridium gasigenes]